MPIYKAVILAVVQGLTELLPVSSSAHVIVVAKMLREDMSTPANALLLVMLHTGTMVAVVAYFWWQWIGTFFASFAAFVRFVKFIFFSTLLSGLVGYPIIKVIEHTLSRGQSAAEFEELFNKLNWIAPALAAAGLLIIFAGIREGRSASSGEGREVGWRDAIWMGIVQGFAIPFRGFSRSGSTISTGLLTNAGRAPVESFSFAMAVAITPLAVGRELYRLARVVSTEGSEALGDALIPGLIGMVCALLAGMLALNWLSRWLEQGRWYWFGIYCLAAAVAVELLYLNGW